jgi:hypothetical protein
MVRLSAGVPDLKKLTERPPFIQSSTDIRTTNFDKVIEAKQSKLRSSQMLTNIGKMVPRDDMILNESERYRNVLLDNSKEQRIKDMRNRKS